MDFHQRWKSLFGADFEVLLYDLTSTYFECDPPEAGKRQFGYSRDKRADCVQVVIALVVTPDGLPLAYEVMAGNTSDKTTLRDFIVSGVTPPPMRSGGDASNARHQDSAGGTMDNASLNRRIEVITGTVRRRRWTIEEKAVIVAESTRPGR